MKVRYFSCFLILVLIFSACSYKKAEEKSTNDFKKLKIKYVKGHKRENKESKDYENLYKKALLGENLSLEKAQGNLASTSIDDMDIEISLMPSLTNPSLYSIFIDYGSDRKDSERKSIEIGPIHDGNSYQAFSLDKKKSSSGDILIVSQVQMKDDFQYSKYSIYNKYMNRMDYAYFYNSNENIDPVAIRSGSILNDGENYKPGNLNSATKERFKAEEEFLKDLYLTYDIKSKPIYAKINLGKIKIGNFPIKDDKSLNILQIKTSDDDINLFDIR